MGFPSLETSRLYLKNISLEDTEFIYSQFSNDAVNEFLFDAEPMADQAEAVDLINFYTIPEPRNQHRWILIRKSDDTKMGTCGFHCWDKTQNRIEVGYDLQKEYWGNGYMQEAMMAILEFAKENMQVKRIDAHIYPHNLRSVALVRKLGFQFHGETTSYNFRGKDYVHQIYTLDI